MRARSAFAATALIGLGLMWSATVAPPALADATVRITASGVTPSQVSVAAGDSVTFQNDDGTRHRLESEDGEGFDTGNIDPGESATVLFSAAGTFGYVDHEAEDDARFSGSVTVGQAAAGGWAGGGGGPGAGGVPEVGRAHG
jgi:plastocyanin